jgi:hypothetical protein
VLSSASSARQSGDLSLRSGDSNDDVSGHVVVASGNAIGARTGNVRIKWDGYVGW